jgi:diguanylate cyclase (GGDEF)-like protein
MGIVVIAEGIETKEEYFTCKDIGADFIQGYFVQKPKQNISKILPKYNEIEKLHENDLRDKKSNTIDKHIIKYINPLPIETLDFMTVFRYFKKHKNSSFVPIIDETNTLKGIIKEEDIRDLSYSQYGISLAHNTNFKSLVEKHINHIVSADINWTVDKILEIYNVNTDITNGIFMLDNGKYYGYIDLKNLLNLSYKRNIEIVSEQNPLTKLPGNQSIELYLNKVFKPNAKDTYSLIYFDFNNFKPFNDTYGFRKGDRAILVFRDILKKKLGSNFFIAHIGGDDFFAGIKNMPYEDVFKLISKVQESFKNQVSSLYSKEDRDAGYVEIKDRFDIKRKFDLLSVSCAIIEICSNIKKEEFDEIIGSLKKESKKRTTPTGASIICNQITCNNSTM